jgi:hypothetical protein
MSTESSNTANDDDPPIDDPLGLAGLEPQMRRDDEVIDFTDVDLDELTKPVDLDKMEDWIPKDEPDDSGTLVDKLSLMETGEVQALRRTLRIHCFECLHWDDQSPSQAAASHETEMAANDRLGYCLYNTPSNQGRNPATFPVTTQKFSCSRGEHLIAKFGEIHQIPGAFRKSRIDMKILERFASLLNDQVWERDDLSDEDLSSEWSPGELTE